MKRIAISMLALAITAAAGGAISAPQDYRNDSRDGYDYNDGRNNDNRSGYSGSRNDIAQVIRVERMNNGSRPYERQECWNEQTND